MISIPFIYFSLLALFLYRRSNSFDVSTFICTIYATSGLFSIFAYRSGISEFGLAEHNISFLSAFSYCFLLTICLFPFMTYSSSVINEIRPVKNEFILKTIAWLSFGCFAITVLFSISTFIQIITGDLDAIRSALYEGDNEMTAYTIALPFPFPLLIAFLNICFNCSWILIFLAFFSLVVQHLHVKYFFLYMLASLSGPWSSVLGVDRSGFAYYILSLLLVFIFFRPMMAKHVQKKVGIVLASVLGLSLFYLSMVTLSRFDDDSDAEFSGVDVGLVSYLGQSYPNFCYFFETFESPFKTLNLLTPAISKYVLGEKLVGGTTLQQYIGDKTNQPLGVFYTYLGNILVTSGRGVMVIFCFLYTYILYRFFSKLQESTLSIIISYVYLLGASVMVLGLFAYFYSTPYRTLSCLAMFYIIWRMDKSDNLICDNGDDNLNSR